MGKNEGGTRGSAQRKDTLDLPLPITPIKAIAVSVDCLTVPICYLNCVSLCLPGLRFIC